MTQFPEILVIRHGETEWNRLGRMQGRLDSPLTEKGRAQARGLEPLLIDAGLTQGSHKILSSPQGRSMHTAEIALAAFDLCATPDVRLAEIDVGRWSGLTKAQIADQGGTSIPNEPHHAFCARAPGGEGIEGLWQRCEALLAGLTRPAVLFTHGVTSRVLRTIAMGWGRDRLGDLPGGQGIIFRVQDGSHQTLAPGDRSA